MGLHENVVICSSWCCGAVGLGLLQRSQVVKCLKMGVSC